MDALHERTPLARFLDGEDIESNEVFDNTSKPAPDHSTSRRSGQRASIQERFRQFHAVNPLIYELFCEYARVAKAKGYEKLGIQFIAERIRWRLTVETEDRNSNFKINQDYLSRYSRLIEEQEPDLKDFFTKRVLVTL